MTDRAVTTDYQPLDKCEFRLSAELTERIWTLCRPFRNADAMRRLAFYVARKHSGERLHSTFTLDRRALALCPDLGLSEDVIRGAIAGLVAAGFLPRSPETPKAVRCDATGGFRRPAVQFTFSDWFRKAYLAGRALFRRCSPISRFSPKEETRLGGLPKVEPVKAQVGFARKALELVKARFAPPDAGGLPPANPARPVDPASALGRKLASMGIRVGAPAGEVVTLAELDALHGGPVMGRGGDLQAGRVSARFASPPIGCFDRLPSQVAPQPKAWVGDRSADTASGHVGPP